MAKKGPGRFVAKTTEGRAVNRLQWQQMAERWLVDAKGLLDAHSWSAGYYVAGYAVECGLKACVLARVEAAAEVIFSERRFSERCWTHNLVDLVKLAGLEAAMISETGVNPVFYQHWQVVKDWSENARYQTTHHQKAKKLYLAIKDNANGVMQWVKVHW